MPRQLILVPRLQQRFIGATAIESGYAKRYTPDEMRTWADDLDRCNRTQSADLDRWQITPSEQLSPEQRRTLAVREKYFRDPQAGIQGSLRPDGRIELDGGRHRAGYILERGVDPVAVWVSGPDQRALDAFSAQCERELRPVRNTAPVREDRRRIPGDAKRREPDRKRDSNAGSGDDRARA